MSIYKKIRDALYDGTVALYSNTEYYPTVIYSHGNGETPLNSFVTINPILIEQTGRVLEDVAAVGDISSVNRTAHFQSFHTATIQFGFHGPEAGELAEVFHRLVNNYVEVRHTWSINGLSPTSKTPIRYNPQRRDTKWEDSFNFDVVFSYRVHEEKEVQWIERITMNTNGNTTSS